jgi:hypothetical protein
MFKQLISSLVGLLVLVTLILMGINIVFSYPYFEYYSIHTATLDLLYNNVTPSELRKLNIKGYFLTPNEITHLGDVASLIFNSRIVLVILSVISLTLLYRLKRLRIAITLRSWLWAIFIGGAASTAYAVGGSRMISGFLHPIFFPQGNWVFDNFSLIRKIYGRAIIEDASVFALGFTIISLILLTIFVMWQDYKKL